MASSYLNRELQGAKSHVLCPWLRPPATKTSNPGLAPGFCVLHYAGERDV